MSRLPRLHALLAPYADCVRGEADPEVRGLTLDSREIEPGWVHVARRGAQSDGHRFAADALRKGAVAILAEAAAALPPLPAELPCWEGPVDDAALARLADAFHGSPSRSLRLAGVTGTNGKTSVVHLLHQLAQGLGLDAARIGTLGFVQGHEHVEGPNTTPDPLTLQHWLARARDRGAELVAMEVSSHGLALGRVDTCLFDAVAFTQLGRDHLDFHGSAEAYFEAKARLFSDFPEAARAAGKAPVALWVAGAPGADAIEARVPPGVARLPVGRADGAALRIELLGRTNEGSRLRLHLAGAHADFHSFALLEHEIDNLALALGLAHALHPSSAADLATVATALQAPPGRLERVAPRLPQAPAPAGDAPPAPAGESVPPPGPAPAGDAPPAPASTSVSTPTPAPAPVSPASPALAPPHVYVDYAHTPDALASTLASLRRVTTGPLGVLIGAGGDRDPGKRPLLARAALDHADHVVLTSDNPRSEDPDAILDAMTASLAATDDARIHRDPDRGRAIAHALSLPVAHLVLAGKGHERTQTIAGRAFSFSDAEEARRALAARWMGTTPATTPLLCGWSPTRLAAAVGGRLAGVGDPLLTGLSTDTRTLRPGEIFVALRGERFDGHDHVDAAIAAGAALAIVSEAAEATGRPDAALPRLVVPEPLVAMGALASALLREARARAGGLRTLGLTGSNGKTTTKELLRHLLAAEGPERVLATPGNWNNHIGLPLTVAALTPAHRFAVLEMGANAPDDIEELAAIARPDVGLVTSIGAAHLEGFGGLDGVRRAKAGIVRGASLETLVLPRGEAELALWRQGAAPSMEVRTFGESGDLRVERRAVEGPVHLEGSGALAGWRLEVREFLPGLHNAQNLAGALLALAALRQDATFPPAAQMRRWLASLPELPDGRLRRVQADGMIVIDDAYNANPSSMAASLSILAAARAPRAVVLGGMGELGAAAEALHREVGARAGRAADLVVVVADEEGRAAWLADGARGEGGAGVHVAADAEQAAAIVRNWASGLDAEAVVLVKASRALRLEKVVARLCAPPTRD